jgi:cobalt-zinc-cadmium efflux system outer membrane protein
MKSLKALALPAAFALLAGCATPSLPQLQADSAQLRAQRSVVPAGAETLAAELAGPLDADGAVRVALLHNPAVRATLAQLQFAQGDLYDALRPPNPAVDLSRLDAAGGVNRFTWSVSQPLLDLLFAGYRRQHGELALREAQHLVADQLLRLERDVRQAWLQHTAAALRLRVAQRAAEAAELAAQLAQGYRAAGNITEFQWRAEQAQASQAQLQLAAREAEALDKRMALLGLLGLRHDQPGLRFDERLMLPAAMPGGVDSLADQAVQQRLDLAAQAAALEIAQRDRQHARRWRWLPGADLRIESERNTGEATMTGPGVTLQLPLPNTGVGRVARADALVEVRNAELAALRLAVQNRVTQDGALLDIARRSFDVHARNLLQVNQRMLELAGEQHNFMLIGSFELLGVRRRHIEGHDLWIDAIESWWRAFNDLSYESGVALPVPAAAAHVSAEDLP